MPQSTWLRMPNREGFFWIEHSDPNRRHTRDICRTQKIHKSRDDYRCYFTTSIDHPLASVLSGQGYRFKPVPDPQAEENSDA